MMRKVSGNRFPTLIHSHKPFVRAHTSLFMPLNPAHVLTIIPFLHTRTAGLMEDIYFIVASQWRSRRRRRCITSCVCARTCVCPTAAVAVPRCPNDGSSSSSSATLLTTAAPHASSPLHTPRSQNYGLAICIPCKNWVLLHDYVLFSLASHLHSHTHDMHFSISRQSDAHRYMYLCERLHTRKH